MIASATFCVYFSILHSRNWFNSNRHKAAFTHGARAYIPTNRLLFNGYHTSHFFSGFMPDPTGQLKSFAKCSMLESGPRILYFPGE